MSLIFLDTYTHEVNYDFLGIINFNDQHANKFLDSTYRLYEQSSDIRTLSHVYFDDFDTRPTSRNLGLDFGPFFYRPHNPLDINDKLIAHVWEKKTDVHRMYFELYNGYASTGFAPTDPMTQTSQMRFFSLYAGNTPTRLYSFGIDTIDPDPNLLFKIGIQRNSNIEPYTIALNINGTLSHSSLSPIRNRSIAKLLVEFNINQVDGFVRLYVNDKLEIDFSGNTNPLGVNTTFLHAKTPFVPLESGIRNFTIWDDVDDGGYFVGLIETPFEVEMLTYQAEGIKNETTPINSISRIETVATPRPVLTTGDPILSTSLGGTSYFSQHSYKNNYLSTKQDGAQLLYTLSPTTLDEVDHIIFRSRTYSSGVEKFTISPLMYKDSTYKKGQGKENENMLSIETTAPHVYNTILPSQLLDLPTDVNDEPWTKQKVMETQFGFLIDAI